MSVNVCGKAKSVFLFMKSIWQDDFQMVLFCFLLYRMMTVWFSFFFFLTVWLNRKCWLGVILNFAMLLICWMVLKSRDITLPAKVSIVKALVFPVVMYGYESWAIKKAECWIINAFELWCWRRLLGVPWTARRSNQSILKEISPGC